MTSNPVHPKPLTPALKRLGTARGLADVRLGALSLKKWGIRVSLPHPAPQTFTQVLDPNLFNGDETMNAKPNYGTLGFAIDFATARAAAALRGAARELKRVECSALNGSGEVRMGRAVPPGGSRWFLRRVSGWVAMVFGFRG